MLASEVVLLKVKAPDAGIGIHCPQARLYNWPDFAVMTSSVTFRKQVIKALPAMTSKFLLQKIGLNCKIVNSIISTKAQSMKTFSIYRRRRARFHHYRSVKRCDLGHMLMPRALI